MRARLAAGSLSALRVLVNEATILAVQQKEGGLRLATFDADGAPRVWQYKKGTRVLISLWDSLMFGRVPENAVPHQVRYASRDIDDMKGEEIFWKRVNAVRICPRNMRMLIS